MMQRRQFASSPTLCEAIKEQTGLSRLDGDISLVPPPDLNWLDLLAETGITALSMNLEVLNEQLFRYICPGKNEIGLGLPEGEGSFAPLKIKESRTLSTIVMAHAISTQKLWQEHHLNTGTPICRLAVTSLPEVAGREGKSKSTIFLGVDYWLL
jgi:hypothetical protein